MNLLVKAFLVSIGYHSGKLIYEIAGETIFNILHKTEWYCALNKKEIPNKPNRMKVNEVKNKIGF